MPAKYLLATACALALNLTAVATFAGANDYAFEPLTAELKKGDDVVVALRLTQPTASRLRTLSSSAPVSTWRPTAWPTWCRP